MPSLLVEIALPFVLLVLWSGIALSFRSQEKKKRREIMDRLHLYESEAKSLDVRSSAVAELLRVDEKKKAHLASMIREREKSFRDLLDVLHRTLSPHTCALYLYDEKSETSFSLVEQ